MALRRLCLVAMLALVCALSAAAETAPAAPVLLRYHFDPAVPTDYVAKTAMSCTVGVNPQQAQFTMPLQMSIVAAVGLKTAEVLPDGNGALIVRLHTVSVQGGLMGDTSLTTLDFDRGLKTEGGATTLMTIPNDADALEKLHLVLTPQGKLVDLRHLEEHLAAKALAHPEQPAEPPPTPEAMQGLRAFLAAQGAALPEKPVAVGDTWTQSVSLLMPDSEPLPPIEMHYTLEALEAGPDGGQVAVLAVSSVVALTNANLKPPFPQAPAGQGGALILIHDLHGTLDGKLRFDVTGGRMLSGEMAMSFSASGDVTPAAPAPTPAPAGTPAATPQGAGGPAPGTPPAAAPLFTFTLTDAKLTASFGPPEAQ